MLTNLSDEDVRHWDDTVVLVTGGCGSFGSRFLSVLLRVGHPKRVIVYSRDELKHHRMRERFPDDPASPVRYILGDVRDAGRLKQAMRGVDIVIHAAAMKQIPACEEHPFEAVQTNIVGSENVIQAAIEAKVKKVLAISTDKAVSPVSAYGATKLISEKLFVQANDLCSETRFSCIRYGNVLGSSGSVIPLFLHQRASGRVTVTDKRMTRFWLTSEQGVAFVIGRLRRMEGGEVFVPKAPSTSIMEVVEAVAPDCEISLIGTRPGEKIHELLISEEEGRRTIEADDMFVVLSETGSHSSSDSPKGQRMEDGFSFGSASNPRFLNSRDLRELIDTEAPSFGNGARS